MRRIDNVAPLPIVEPAVVVHEAPPLALPDETARNPIRKPCIQISALGCCLPWLIIILEAIDAVHENAHLVQVARTRDDRVVPLYDAR